MGYKYIIHIKRSNLQLMDSLSLFIFSLWLRYFPLALPLKMYYCLNGSLLNWPGDPNFSNCSDSNSKVTWIRIQIN